MNKGRNYDIDYILQYVGTDNEEVVKCYVAEKLKENYYIFKDEKDILTTLGNFISEYKEVLSDEDKQVLKGYTGLEFRKINSLLRRVWDYEINGRLTDDIKKQSYILAEQMRRAIYQAVKLPIGIISYRGVSIRSFYDYQITTIEDLIYMKDQYYYASAFTSTSLLQEKCFYYEQSSWSDKANILIEYYIPSGSDDGILLADEELSYSSKQWDFLINSSSLFKVIDVFVSEDKTYAKLKMLLIPEQIWNKRDYDMERNK